MAHAYKIFLITLALIGSYLAYDIVRMHMIKAELNFAPPGFFVGPEDAEVTIVEFLDYSCIKCQQSHPGLKAFLERNRDVRYIPRPVLSQTEIGKKAGQFVYAAGAQGYFLNVHHLLLESGRAVDDALIDEITEMLKMDKERLKADMEHPNVIKILEKNFDYNEALGSPTIPTYFINSQMLWVINNPNRIPGVEDFETVINEVRRSR